MEKRDAGHRIFEDQSDIIPSQEYLRQSMIAVAMAIEKANSLKQSLDRDDDSPIGGGTPVGHAASKSKTQDKRNMICILR